MESTKASAIYCLVIGIQVTVGIFIEQPENTVAMLDERTTFKCRSDETGKVRWHMFANDLEEVELWNGYELNPNAIISCSRCAIDIQRPEGYTFNITARKEAAKHYVCTEPGTSKRASASLTVLESKLKCKHEHYFTSNGTTLSCSIGFYGEWIPKIKWRRSDGKQLNEDDVKVYNISGEITSTLTAPPTKPVVVQFIASVHFIETERPTAVTATNIPNYTDEWTSPLFYLEVFADREAKKEFCEDATSRPALILSGVTGGVVWLGGIIILAKNLQRRRSRERRSREVLNNIPLA